jgi:MinD superfamily P-loop ATPase
VKRIVVASGKGGTGKTTISIGLHQTLTRDLNKEAILYDFDVEEPNDHLFYQELILKKSIGITIPIPQIDEEKCTFCGKCKSNCAFNAITLIPKANIAQVSKELCHSCGACVLVCKDDAITEIEHPIGEINEFGNNGQVLLKEGRLEIGLPHQTALIRQLKKSHIDKSKIAIFDAPPGTSCPVVHTVEGADYIIVVAEPSPFGLNDLKLLVEVLREINLPFGVIINKADNDTKEMENYLQNHDIELIAKIPYSKNVAKGYSKADKNDFIYGNNLSEQFMNIWNFVAKKINF